MSEKLRAALATREDPEFMIIARCDAYGPEGLDGAMRRAERYLATGVDGAFLPGLSRPEELRQVGEAFGDKHLMTVMVQGSPIWTAPRELGEMGFSQIVYPGHMMTRMVETLDRALADLREYGNGAGDLPDQAGAGRARETLADVLRNEFWSRAGN